MLSAAGVCTLSLIVFEVKGASLYSVSAQCEISHLVQLAPEAENPAAQRRARSWGLRRRSSSPGAAGAAWCLLGNNLPVDRAERSLGVFNPSYSWNSLCRSFTQSETTTLPLSFTIIIPQRLSNLTSYKCIQWLCFWRQFNAFLLF